MGIGQPDPPLTDGLVRLRPWTLDDVPAIVAACGEEQIVRWLDMIPHPYTEQDGIAYVTGTQESWRDRRGASFAVVDAATGDVLGSIGLRVQSEEDAVLEVGYWVKSEARGRGIASRALRLVTDWALEDVGAERLQLRAEARNEASIRVAEGVGFRREGVLRSSHWLARQGRRGDWIVFSVLPSDKRT